MRQVITAPEFPFGALFEYGLDAVARKAGSIITLEFLRKNGEADRTVTPGDTHFHMGLYDSERLVGHTLATSYLAGRTAVAVVVETPGATSEVAMSHFLRYQEEERRAVHAISHLLQGIVGYHPQRSIVEAVVMTPGKLVEVDGDEMRLAPRNGRLADTFTTAIQERFDGLAEVHVYPYMRGVSAQDHAGVLAVNFLSGGGARIVAENNGFNEPPVPSGGKDER